MEQAVSEGSKTGSYASHINPQWVRLLDLLQMNVQYERCEGTELFTSDGRRILDFLSGFCVYNAGHNHPSIIAALKDELDKKGPVMLQSHVPELAGMAAQRLCALSGGQLKRVVFCNSGSEGVEIVIKFSRAYTKRAGLLYCHGAFHGLTCGALSLMGDPLWREGFGPFLPDTEAIPFNDLKSLEEKLKTKKFAAFILEPMQSEAGIRLPEGNYLQEVQRLCHRYGTLFVLDEVQTGVWRTGPFLAAHHYDVQPDMVVLAKALSGGLVPVGAVLMSEKISNAVYSSLKRANIHASTFSENALSMRTILATLDVLETEGWGSKSAALAADMRERLSTALAPYEMFKTVRGVGMFTGIEWQAPKQLRRKISFETIKHIHPAIFGQILVMQLFREKGILTQICGNDFMVLKVVPPLVTTPEQIDYFVKAMTEVADMIHTSDALWSEALGVVTRTIV
jgi:ornithine--oxo-acid transaminase